MRPFLLRDVLAATGASLLRGGAEQELSGVSTDSRSLSPGELFIALSGARFDGNGFAVKAHESGAGALLLRGTERAVPEVCADPSLQGAAVLLHPDPIRALGEFAHWVRSTLDAVVIGVTGSCGKTTTKNILLELLSGVRRVYGSRNSYNNEIGVPLTLLGADADCEVLIVEMGTNNPGEIAALCRMARPDAGVITNIGVAHLSGLGSIDGIADEKGALVRSLAADGFCVLPVDGMYTPQLSGSTAAQVVTFGVDAPADISATEIEFHSGGTSLRVGERHINSPLLGLHNVHNLMAALATVQGLGVSLDDVLPAISRLKTPHGRMERISLRGLTVFDDSYNANPDSARASVRVLAGTHGHTRRVLVLGDMLELGELAAELHFELGREAAAAGIDCLILIGELARAAGAGALEGGFSAEQVKHFTDVHEVSAAAAELFGEGDVILVKGSRKLALEHLVQHLQELFAPEEAS